MFYFHIDIHTIAAIKSDESYSSLSTGFKNIFDDINDHVKPPYITINGVDYTLEFFLSADYKVASYLIVHIAK